MSPQLRTCRPPRLSSLETRLAPAIFTVSNTLDSGAGSLRQAIFNANGAAGADTVDFDASFTTVKTITLTTGQLIVTDSLTVTGPGPGLLTVSGNNTGRVLLANGTGTLDVTVSGLTIANGKTLTGNLGAGIYAAGENLTLQNCVITNNHAWNVGGVWVNAPGVLTLTDCQITNNKSDIHGGGAGGSGGVVVTRTTISGNTAANRCGGLYARPSLLMQDSTVSGNSAGVNGGGLDLVAPGGGSFVIRNSTISGNTAMFNGAGIVLGHYYTSTTFNGALTVHNSTITNNTNVSNYSVGPGIDLYSGGGSIAVESTIISGNKVAGLAEDIFSNKTVTLKTSAIGSAAGFTATDLGGNLPFGADVKLAALGNYGGPTRTHALLPGSAAIGKGSNPAGLASDQRGPAFARNAGGIDIGATEARLPPFVVTNTSDAGPGSLRQAIFDANAVPGPDTITFDPVEFATAKTITLTSGELAFSDDTTVTGPGAALMTISGNNASRIVSVSSSSSVKVTLTGLTLTGGNAGNGGAVFVGELEILTLGGCRITGNVALFNGGGVFLAQGAKLSATDSTISGNTASKMGGGVYFYLSGALTLTGCTVSGNSAGGQGGGVYFVGLATGGGGFNGLSIINSTISGNTAGTDGGGVALVAFSGPATIVNSTVTANQAGGNGGGLFRDSGTGVVTFTSTIISGNSKVSGAGGEIWTNKQETLLTSLCGSSMHGALDLDSTTFALLGQNPQLGPLTNNFGPTFTHMIFPSSPAINQGSNPLLLSQDQRGYPRTLGGQIDVGAVERVLPLVVTNANDSALGSLRGCIAEANSVPGADTIFFDPAFFNVGRTITLTSGAIQINSPVALSGPGASLATVSGNNASRVFQISASAGNVTMVGLTITKGAEASSIGGGILAEGGNLTLQSCVVTGNAAKNNGGGGIFAYDPGVLTLLDCQVTNNSTGFRVGGIVAAGGAVIRRSTISGNTATGECGGLAVGVSLVLEDSTVTGNSAASGGGIWLLNPATGSFVVRNSTISGNSAQSVGGGILLGLNASAKFDGTLTVQNSTIANNTVPFGTGGGIALATGTGTIALESAIVAGNTAAAHPDVSSPLSVTLKTSAVGSSSGFTQTDLGGNVPFGADLKLAPLLNNGGPTLTHALLPGSAAINKGSNPAGLTNDQRGGGFLRAVGAPDIGAFESQTAVTAPPVVSSLVINGGVAQRSVFTSLKVTFDQTVTLPANPADAFQLQRKSDSALVTLAATVSGSSVTLTFTGGAVDGKSLADGRYTLTAYASKVIGPGGLLDGNFDGAGGDNFVYIASPPLGIFRLFGDNDGDGDVDAGDFGSFRAAFGGTSNLAFDADGDGDVDASDFGQFRQRFGTSV